MDLINKYFSTAYRTQENDYIFLQNEINPSVLKAAYEYGIFPWPMPNEKELTWFAPAKRGVLFLDEFPEFERRAIDALRQPFEDRVVSSKVSVVSNQSFSFSNWL